jgi:hypothetical protein
MNGTEFRLYRLNLVDRINLFEKPVRSDQEIFEIVSASSTPTFDSKGEGSRSGWNWSLRNATLGHVEQRTYISALFSHETTWKYGTAVRPEGVVRGRSEMTPPLASTAQVLFDLKRHIVAVEDLPAITQARSGWKSKLELILNTAAHHLSFTSRLVLDEIAPRHVLEQGLENFQRVTRVRVTLRIPNPDLTPFYKKLYEEMKDANVRELTQDIRSESGLDLAVKKLPRMALDMAVNGYREGTIRIYGYRNGKKEKEKLTIGQDAARIALQEFVHGYEAGNSTAAVNKMARALQEEIDRVLGEN